MPTNRIRNNFVDRALRIKAVNGYIRAEGWRRQTNQRQAAKFNPTCDRAQQQRLRPARIPMHHEQPVNYWFASATSYGPVITQNAMVLRRSSQASTTQAGTTKLRGLSCFFRNACRSPKKLVSATAHAVDKVNIVGRLRNWASGLAACIFLAVALTHCDLDEGGPLILATLAVGGGAWMVVWLTEVSMRLLRKSVRGLLSRQIGI